MKLTWFGCASFQIDCGDVSLWTDPFIEMASNAENHADESTFASASEILISHGHFDHLMNVPGFSAQREVHVHCTETPRKTLLSCAVPEQWIHCCAPGDCFDVNGVSVRVFQGKHSMPDTKMVIGVVFRTITSLRNILNFFKILHVHRRLPEAGETVLFEIIYSGKRIVFIGSPGLPEGAAHPEPGADWLILPYQGTSDPAPTALRIVQTLRPKAVVLSHFDDAIPPLTGKVKIKPFLDTMQAQYPEIPVHVPKFGEAIPIADLEDVAVSS